MAAETAPDIIVIGAGIVGIACAAQLAEAGRSVLVLDRTGICEETSSGNAAALAFPDYLPLAHKGMLRKLPGWLADPLGPLTIPPAYLPRLAPWLWRFLRAGSPRFFDHGVAAQSALMGLAESEWMALAERAGMSGMIRHDGALDLYEGEGDFKATLPGWAVRERLGVSFEHVQGAQLEELQPGLSPRFTHGTFMPSWKTVSNPKIFGKALWSHAEMLGAHFRQARVTAIRPGTTWQVETADGQFSAKTVVLAAGAWSHHLARQVGDRVPLETERGYNTTLPPGAWPLRRQLTFVGHGFVVTPLVDGIRVGGAVELGGLSRAPNFARSKAMLAKAAAFLPGLKTEGGREWMGFRPSLPDSLPVIGPGRAPGLFYAFGHGHLGLTQAAATGRLIRDLVSGDRPALDLAPFSVNRF